MTGRGHGGYQKTNDDTWNAISCVSPEPPQGPVPEKPLEFKSPLGTALTSRDAVGHASGAVARPLVLTRANDRRVTARARAAPNGTPPLTSSQVAA